MFYWTVFIPEQKSKNNVCIIKQIIFIKTRRHECFFKIEMISVHGDWLIVTFTFLPLISQGSKGIFVIM